MTTAQKVSSYKLLGKLLDLDGVQAASISEGGTLRAVLCTPDVQQVDIAADADAAWCMVGKLADLGCEGHRFDFARPESITCVQQLDNYVVVVVTRCDVKMPLLELSFQMVAQILETSEVSFSPETEPAAAAQPAATEGQR